MPGAFLLPGTIWYAGTRAHEIKNEQLDWGEWVAGNFLLNVIWNTKTEDRRQETDNRRRTTDDGRESELRMMTGSGDH